MLSLREAIIAANTNTAFGDAPAGDSASVDQIIFSPTLAGGTITLGNGELSITDARTARMRLPESRSMGAARAAFLTSTRMAR